MQSEKYAKNMQLKICINMHKICNKYAAPHDYASYVKICKNMQKYANICKICQHDFYMQNMHSPLCLWRRKSRGGSGNTSSAKGTRKQGPHACCRGNFHWWSNITSGYDLQDEIIKYIYLWECSEAWAVILTSKKLFKGQWPKIANA